MQHWMLSNDNSVLKMLILLVLKDTFYVVQHLEISTNKANMVSEAKLLTDLNLAWKLDGRQLAN